MTLHFIAPPSHGIPRTGPKLLAMGCQMVCEDFDIGLGLWCVFLGRFLAETNPFVMVQLLCGPLRCHVMHQFVINDFCQQFRSRFRVYENTLGFIFQGIDADQLAGRAANLLTTDIDLGTGLPSRRR